MSLGEIYVILRNHFRSLTISRIQQSSPPGAHRIDLDDPTCLDLTPALHDLRDKIHRKKSKYPIATTAFKKRNGGSETSPSQFAEKTKTFTKVMRSPDKQRIPLSK
jgi:hypothetical protein